MRIAFQECCHPSHTLPARATSSECLCNYLRRSFHHAGGAYHHCKVARALVFPASLGARCRFVLRHGNLQNWHPACQGSASCVCMCQHWHECSSWLPCPENQRPITASMHSVSVCVRVGTNAALGPRKRRKLVIALMHCWLSWSPLPRLAVHHHEPRCTPCWQMLIPGPMGDVRMSRQSMAGYPGSTFYPS